MPNMSVRDLNAKTLANLKRRAAKEGSSLNSLVLRLLQGASGPGGRSDKLRPFADLDKLVGTWNEAQAREFDAAVAANAEIDQSLWK